MSQLAISQEWMTDILTAYADIFTELELQCHLYQNDFQPEDDSEIGDFVVCDFSGYDGPRDVSTWSLGGIFWNAPRMTMPGPVATWVVTAGGVENDVYGYFITDSSGNYKWAQKLDASIHAGDTPGDEVRATTEYSVRSEFHSTS